jgi:hypothetical protein
MFRQQAKPRGGTEEIFERRRENYPWPTGGPTNILFFFVLALRSFTRSSGP